MQGAIEQVTRSQPQIQAKRIKGEPEPFDAELGRIFHQQAEHHRVQMHVQMAVDVVQREAGGPESLKLRVNFLAQRLAQVALEIIPEPGSGGVVGEFAIGVHQPGNLLGGQCGMAAQQGQVQSHPQPRVVSRQRHGLFLRRLVDHQARRGQNTLAVRAHHRLVDRSRAAEIIRVDDQPAKLSAQARPHSLAPLTRRPTRTRCAG